MVYPVCNPICPSIGEQSQD
uniref:Uncharacterized protein n=1 Tax=Arundo donax TaxID=35708 RepID=A0A0A8Y0N5_ARUDO